MMLGTDPEFFVLDEKGRSIPAHKVGAPIKEEALRVPNAGRRPGSEAYFSIFRDGYAIEVNVPPSACRQEITWRMQAAIYVIRKFMLREGERLSTVPGVEVAWDRMENAPPDLLEVGCSPSEDAYTGESKSPAIDPRTSNWRFAGGHLHFSEAKQYTDNAHSFAFRDANIPTTVKLLDLYVGLPLTLLYPSKEGFLRRQFYGQAGEFRRQSYGTGGLNGAYKGIEYRVPTPEIWGHQAAASLAMGAGRWVLQNAHSLKWDKGIESDLRGAINEGIGVKKLIRTAPGIYDLPALEKAAEVLQKESEHPLPALDPMASGWDSFLSSRLKIASYSIGMPVPTVKAA